jgi:hypothetical protein
LRKGKGGRRSRNHQKGRRKNWKKDADKMASSKKDRIENKKTANKNFRENMIFS